MTPWASQRSVPTFRLSPHLKKNQKIKKEKKKKKGKPKQKQQSKQQSSETWQCQWPQRNQSGLPDERGGGTAAACGEGCLGIARLLLAVPPHRQGQTPQAKSQLLTKGPTDRVWLEKKGLVGSPPLGEGAAGLSQRQSQHPGVRESTSSHPRRTRSREAKLWASTQKWLRNR